MPLSPGTRIGPYEVSTPLGAGGMGEVYRARDTKLDRSVAIKILPGSFSNTPDRIARFEREAKTLASMNHPNIASIYGFEDTDGVQALVMELVEGPTLADRIARGAIPIEEAVPIARQIADALEAAHEQGIVHRDLKPANIKLRPDGTVKVLDFGLAKALTQDPGPSTQDLSQSPTITTPAMTQMGMILGTAAYMSPEQAKGKPVDRRADIWAFGVVLYEMLTGMRLFGGEDLTETLASVVKEQPDLSAAPPKVRRLLEKCLEKDPKKRLRDIGDVWELLDHGPQARAAVTHSRLPWAVAVGAAVVAVALAMVHFSEPTSEPPAVMRFSYEPPISQRLNLTYPAIAIAPNGRSFAFTSTGSQGLQLRAMGSLEATPVPGTEGNVTTPFFSPNGMSVGYFQNGQLKRIAINGGGPRVIAPATRSFGASWAADDTILFSQPQGILRVSAEGGTPEVVIPAEEGERFDGPQLLPGGRTVLFSRTTGTWNEADVVAESLVTGARKVLLPGGSAARYLPTGHLVYALDARLFAVAFDPDSVAVSGEGVPLVEGVTRGLDSTAANYGVSDSGTLVYVTVASIDRGLVWVGRNGQEQPLSTPFRDYQNLSLSPDGRRAALEVAENGTSEVWVTELERGTLTRLTEEKGFSAYPIWSLDGRRVVFSTRQNGRWELRSRAADGTGEAALLARFDETVQEVRSSSWLPDGATVVFDVLTPDTGYDIALLSVEEPGKWRPLIQTAASEAKPAVSPDGRWIAYQSTEGGETQIYLQRLPGLGDRRQVSVGSAIHFNATWSRDGNALFYVRVGATFDMLRSSFGGDTAGAPVIGPAVLQLSYRFFSAPWTFRTWDLSPDEDRFLMIGLGQGVHPDSAESRPQIIIVQNWHQELLDRVPVD